MSDSNQDFTALAYASVDDVKDQFDRIGMKTFTLGVLLGLGILGYFLTVYVLWATLLQGGGGDTVKMHLFLLGMAVNFLLWLAILLNTGLLYRGALKEKDYREAIFSKLQLMGATPTITNDGSRPCSVNYKYNSRSNACEMIHSQMS